MADEAEASYCRVLSCVAVKSQAFGGIIVYRFLGLVCVPDASSIQSLHSVVKQSTAEEIKDA